ncbi:Intracellular distribution of mitochondria, partial [Coemansia javaensis]
QQQQPQAGPAEPVPPRGWQAGGVRVVDPAQWSAAAAADDPEEIAGLVSTLRGLQSPGHFGRALAAAGPDVWIGEPLSGPGEDGRIHRWRAGRLQCFAAPGAMRGARFGTSIAAAGSVLVVAAPHDSQQSRVAGSVVVAAAAAAVVDGGEPAPAVNGSEPPADGDEAAAPQEDATYRLTIRAPNGASVPVVATAQETIQDIRYVVGETAATIEYSCFYLALDGQRLVDTAELGEIAELGRDAVLDLVEDQYTEREARVHVSRLRSMLAGRVTANPDVAGLDAGASIFGTIKHPGGDRGDDTTAAAAPAAAMADSDSAGRDADVSSGGDSARPAGKRGGKKKRAAEEEEEGEEAEAGAGGEAEAERQRAAMAAAAAAAAAAADHAFKGFEFAAVPPFDVLSPRKALERLAPPQCVRQLVLSGWNPVPRYRQLKGDLLYLLVTTVEGQSYHITCAHSGFYVNASTLTRFSATPYGEAFAGQAGVRSADFYAAHSLVTLLRRLSARFARGLDELQSGAAQREAMETMPFVSSEQAATPWLARGSENRAPEAYDAGRPQDVFLRAGAQAADSLRDWNEELQSIREMPRGNLAERVLRDRQFHKWHSEFAEAAVLGAMAVVDGEMPALNPGDPPEQHMYLRDNIFYSKGFDGRENFAGLGGDAAAHAATGKDITGVRLLNQLDVDGLSTLGSVAVDYRGLRVVAQSVVPGIFRRQETTQIVYGSIDGGKTIGADAEFHALLEPVAKALHLGAHTVADKDGAEHTLYTSVDAKGLVGTDGRKYLLDLYRMTPVDVEFLERECDATGSAGDDDGGGDDDGTTMPRYPHKLVLLRPELVDVFWENSLRKAAQEYMAAKPSALAGFEFDLRFSPDSFTPTQSAGKGRDALDAAVRRMSAFLREVSVPMLARDLAAYTTSPLTGEALTTAMHQRGINMRYLGLLASLLPADVESTRNVRRLVVFEMVARAAKHVVRGLLRATPPPLHAEAFALVANALVGARYCADPAAHLSAAARAVPELAALTPQTLAAAIRAQVALRFRFRLGAGDLGAALVAGSERILLREVCLKAGVQLALQQYHFVRPAEAAVHAEAVAALGGGGGGGGGTSGPGKLTKAAKRSVRERVDAVLARPVTVLADDVLNFVARTKVSAHTASLADEAFEAGRASLERGQRELGLELLLESLALHEQTFGFLHPESARCYAVVSLASYEAGEHAQAADFMTKAVVISERTVGLDNPLTIHNYLNLALYEHARGNTLLALRLMRHAMDLWGLVNSPDHPDLATAHNNIGVMLQALGQYGDALRFFRSCLDIRTGLLGADHVLVANAQHSLAKAHAVAGDFKAAVQAERDAHRFFADRFGPDDPRTKETAEWLAELTFNAVRTAKLSRAAQDKIRAIAATADLARVDGKEDGAAATTEPAAAARGSLPIDELLKFITGSASGGSGSGGRKPKGARRAKGPKGARR